MRKNILSLSIAAMIGGLGLAGGASAGVYTTGSLATELVVAPEGVGHILMVPHYTAQSSNMSLLNIVNTDESNGKVVKVRFRGAANSDDVLDFLLFLSPGDVWAGNVSKHADGMAFLTTPDNSCVLPSSVKAPAGTKFVTSRVNPVGGDSGKAEETLEGYVEILNTANIPESAKPLYTTTKHKADGTVECAPAKLDTYFGKEFANEAAAISAGLSNPTGGLFANWSIFNVTDASAWTGAATAVSAVLADGTAAPANMVVFPQVAQSPLGITASNIDSYTADPLAKNVASAGFFQLQAYDLPDLSTPYLAGTTSAAVQAGALSQSLAKTDIKNEYITDSSVSATTDWIFSMPTRRYAVAVNYTVANAGTGNAGLVTNPANARYFDDTNTFISSVINGKKLACVDVDGVKFWDRSERTPDAPTDEIVISPSEPNSPNSYNFCGEVSIWSFGATGAKTTLNGLVSTKNADIPYTDGWAKFDTTNGGVGLPILGYSVMKFLNGPMGFGLSFPHRYTQGPGTPVVTPEPGAE